MSKLTWDGTGTRRFQAGVSMGVLYTIGANEAEGHYASTASPWNGLINITKSPDGAEANDLWADNIKYGSLRSAENAKGSIEAYTYPDAFEACQGRVALGAGVYIGEQARKKFGLCWRTEVGDDQTELGDETAGKYIIHIAYGCSVSPSEESDDTINDSPDAATLSWDWETTPLEVTGHKPTATIDIKSWEVAEGKLAAIEEALYGAENKTAYLPTPDGLLAILTAT